MSHFSDCNMQWKVDFIWQLVMISLVVGPRSSKALSKAKLVPKKRVMVIVWWSAAGLTHYSFLNPSKTITPGKHAQPTDEMHWKLQPALVNRKGPWQCPTTHHITNASKVGWIGLQSFASSTIFTWPLANRLPLLQASWQLFAGKMLPQAARCRQCFPRVCLILKHRFLHDRDK